MPDENSKKTTTAKDNGAAEPVDLLGGLESLLEEEGSGFDLPDDDLTENDITDLFAEDSEDVAEDLPPPQSHSRGAESSRDARRQDRTTRRRRDLEDYRNLEAHLQATPLGVVVAEDRMTARISRITADNSLEEITDLLRGEGITHGVDGEAIRAALAKAGRGQNQFEVLIARGTPPRVIKPTTIVHHLPRNLITGDTKAKTPFERLKLAIEGPYLEACKSWQGPVKIVRKGDALSELIAAQTEPGIDVRGQPLEMTALDDVTLEVGDHVTLSDDGMTAIADLFGYAGLLGGKPTVISPIWLSTDHMEARFVFHAPEDGPAPIPTEEDLYSLLEMKWIEFGIMDRQLELICARLKEKQALPVTVPVAQGTPEIQGEDAQIKYAFDPYELIKWNHLQSILNLKAPEAIEHALREIYEGDHEGADESGVRFKAVRPGEIVVEKIPATTGVPGQDTQGEEVVPTEGKDIPLEVGQGLLTSDDGLRCSADLFGYVAMRWDIEINVISPLWISPDRTAAYFLNLPQSLSPKYPSVEEMQAILDEMKVIHGYVPERWAEIAADLAAGRRKNEFIILIAQGSAPVGGRDAEFEWAVQIDSDKPGKILADGSIDFRDRNLTTVAKEGDLLGKLIPPRLGKPGKDIFGTDLAAPAPLNIEVVTDARIYAEPEEDGSMAFFCETGGGISSDSEVKTLKGRRHMRINIAVYPISNIEGDVDYTSGNIDFSGDVVISGSVQSQFSVKAT
ncbi:MAG: FapA family protein, partial [bacterium]|nr:FapA family protein [bacterium]